MSSNPVLHAFFIGRALADSLRDQLETALTQALSEVGRLDAAQRDTLRGFTEEVLARANQQESTASGTGVVSGMGRSPVDLQEMIDDLRAEVAQLRATLQEYRNR